MSQTIKSGLSFIRNPKTPNIRINEIDVNHLPNIFIKQSFKSIKNEDNLIILDNVLI